MQNLHVPSVASYTHMSYVPLSSILECFLDCALEHATTLCMPACTGHEKTLFNAYSIYIFFMHIYSITWVIFRQLVLVSAVVQFKWRNLKYVSCCEFTGYWSVEYVFVLLEFGFVYCSGIWFLWIAAIYCIKALCLIFGCALTAWPRTWRHYSPWNVS